MRGYSDMALRLSKHCLYMNSQHSESFKGAPLNASDSHGESLLQLKCFSRSPRYSLWMLENMEYFFIFCLSISRDMWTKRQSAFAALLGVRIAVHKRELVCAKKNCFAKKKPVKIRRRAKTRDPIYRVQESIFFLIKLITNDMCTVQG